MSVPGCDGSCRGSRLVPRALRVPQRRLTAEFPAYAARLLGLTDVPLLCASEIAVPGALPRTLRLLEHVETDRSRAQLRHVYLRGAAALRTDLPR